MKAVIVGAGGIARALLRRMSPMWDVGLIDKDPGRLDLAAEIREVRTLVGDGSSLVVLRRAGLAEADALVAATGDDDANLEICRLARREGVSRVVAVAADSRRRTEYAAMGVPAFQPHTLAARQLELHLEPRRVSSTAFAHGRAEALEVQIAADSPVRGKTLRELASGTWLVAALLRGDRLLVPHGDTELETGDIVTVVGEAADLPAIMQAFTLGQARFPLDCGQNVTVALGGGGDAAALAEAARLTHDSPASSLLVVRRTPGDDDQSAAEVEVALRAIAAEAGDIDLRFWEVHGSPVAALPAVCARQSVGMVVVTGPRRGRFASRRAGAALRRAARLRRPVVFARGTVGTGRVVVAVGEGGDASAVRAAIDLATYAGTALQAIAVVGPAFLGGGPEEERLAVERLEAVRADAAAQSVKVEATMRRGNPVREICAAAAGAGLLVLGSPTWPPSALSPGLVGHILARAEASVLVVPCSL